MQYAFVRSKWESSSAPISTHVLTGNRPTVLSCKRLGSRAVSMAGIRPNARGGVRPSRWRAFGKVSASMTRTLTTPGDPIAEAPNCVNFLPSIYTAGRVQTLSELFMPTDSAYNLSILSARRHPGHRAAPHLVHLRKSTMEPAGQDHILQNGAAKSRERATTMVLNNLHSNSPSLPAAMLSAVAVSPTTASTGKRAGQTRQMAWRTVRLSRADLTNANTRRDWIERRR